MKATIFNGSPKKDDTLSDITSSMAESLRANGTGVKEFFLYFMDIRGCIDCGISRPDDEFKELIDELTSSDIAIFACPVYRWNMSGALSAFIEELYSYCKYDDDLANSLMGRKAAVVMVMESEENVADDAIEHLKMFFDKFGMRYAGAFMLPFSDRDKVTDPSYADKIGDFVEQIAEK
jgi:multimeric flavodoxin WrbA